MSEGDSPLRALETSENDPNSSIINKVRSRVSSILPNSLSKWFSPSTSRNDSKNGSLRRRRDSSSDEEGGASNEENKEQSSYTAPPPMKKTKSILSENTSTPNLTESLPHSSSGSNSLTAYTQTTTSNSFISLKKQGLSSSTPTSIILNRRKYLGQNKTSSPYDFKTKNPNLSKQFEKTEIDEEEEEENEEGEDNSIERNNREVKGRRGIRDSSSLENSNLDISKRRKLNLDTSTLKSYSRRSMFDVIENKTNNLSNIRRSSLNSYRRPLGVEDKSSFIDPSAGILEDDEEDEINIPIDDLDDQNLGNGNINETPSDSDGSISCCSATGRPASSTSMQRNEEESGQYPGLFGNRKLMRPTTSSSTGINFSAHLQTEKSLFSDKNMGSRGGLNNSTMSLNSWTRRPSFNASLYGSTSALSDSRIINTKSPFYDGKTMYGGASTYSHNNNRIQKALRAPVQIRPASSLSTLSLSSSASLATDTTNVLSNTAKRILDLMNQFTSPITDAKKMAANVNVNTRIPPLIAHRQRFSEQELQLNRSIRLANIKSPYSRPGGENNRTSNKFSACTNELQIPSVTQLLQMKKLQNNTEKVRQLAADSKSILNKKAEYKLLNQDEPDESGGGSNKHVNKIRNKITKNRLRPDKVTKDDDDVNDNELKLPSIPLPLMKSVPKIDIVISSETTTRQQQLPSIITTKSTIKKIETNDRQQQHNKEDTIYKFSKPITLSASQENTITPTDNFKFSEPLTVVKSNNNCHDINDNKNSIDSIGKSSAFAGFKFTSTTINSPTIVQTLPVPKDSLMPKQTLVDNKIPQLKTGSVLDALKGFNKTPNTPITLQKAPTNTTTTTIEEKNNELPKVVNPILPIISNSFGDTFKVKSDQWECDVCMVRNKSELDKCVACMTPKPGTGTGGNKMSSAVNPLPTTFSGVPISKTNDESFKRLVAQQNEKWECSACMTRNEATRNKCVCCEQSKPGAASENIPKFSFGASSANAPSKFSFGVQSSTTDLSKAIITTTASATFSFGGSTTNATTTSVGITSAPNKKFTFGSVTPVKSNSEVIPTITFGTSAVKDSPSSANFTFGVKPSDSTSSSPQQGGFKFGNLGAPKVETKSNLVEKLPDKNDDEKKPAIEVSAGGFAFGNAVKTTTETEVNKPTISSGFSFGSAVVKQNSSDLTKEENSTTTKSFGDVKPSANFLFGAQMLNKPVIQQSSSSADTTKSDQDKEKGNSKIIGGFGFGYPPGIQTDLSDSNKQKLTSMFGGSDAEKEKNLFTKPTSSNIPQKPPSFMASFNSTETTVTKPPSFGSPNTAIAPITANATLTNAASAPSFGVPPASTNLQPDTKATFSFGGSNKEENKGFGSFSVSKTDNQNLFEGFSGNTTKPTTSTFSATTQSPSTFNFASPASSNIIKTTANTESFAFTASNTNTTAPPTFGMGLTTQTPAFGQTSLPAFGSFAPTQTTTAAQPPRYESTFGQQNSNNTPKFGSQTSSTSSFNTIANSATPSFGSTASIFGAQTQLQTPSTFGVTPITPATQQQSFGVHNSPYDSQQNQQNEPPSAKKSAGFAFGGNTQQQTAPPSFTFGANNNNNNNPPTNKQPFNFSATAAPSFNFGATQQNAAAPFAFGASSTPAATQSFGFTGSAETTPNAPYQFGATSNNNPFAATVTSAQNTQQQPRRKVKATRRLANQR